MRVSGTGLEISASDLSRFLACHHLTGLDLAVARGLRAGPAWRDPALLALQQRGLEHERQYVEVLRGEGLRVLDLADQGDEIEIADVLDALRSGADVILQPSLRDGQWVGRPDVLRRVETPSALGAWSYEVVDTKLARETGGGTVLQLALYSDLLRSVQQLEPERFYVVTPWQDAPIQAFRVNDFASYFRLVRARLAATVVDDPAAIMASAYPEPVAHCDVCRWWKSCDERRRADDHLSLVAGMSRLQGRELQSVGVDTLAQLGSLPLPLPFAPSRGAVESYERIREQARLQLAGRSENRPVYELLPVTAEFGLMRLPAPSPGDIFLDLEGDPFAREGGREYLFGLRLTGTDSPGYRAFWAHTDAEERSAFGNVVALIMNEWATNPGMHVYHYAAYEPSAFKRLMGRHAICEAEVDRMLRAELFVDLHAVVKRSLRASVERYSLKDLEPFFGFTRTVPLETARKHLRVVERALELHSLDLIQREDRHVVETYNRDDCSATERLRTWLEQLRGDVERAGDVVPRPSLGDGTAPDAVDERAQRVQALSDALLDGVSPDPGERSPEGAARWLLAHLLDWHRREAKAPWWEFFRLRDLTDSELFGERAAIAGLEFAARVGGTARSPIDRYCYPSQDTDVRERDLLHLSDGTDFGTIELIDRTHRTIEVKKRGAQASEHPSAVFAHSIVRSDVLAESLSRIAEDIIDNGLATTIRHQAAVALLLAAPPHLTEGTFAPHPGESAVGFATRTVPLLNRTVLAIQGPPGAGKTFCGGQIACDLVRRGMSVGVAAVSHKVIVNLLDAIATAAEESDLPIRCAHKVARKSDETSAIEEIADNGSVLQKLRERQVDVVGGTAWLWARPEFQGAVDVLLVDEAGQMSLADVLAVSHATRSLVLLGDPQQLEQPQQGTHPDGTAVSALEHILGGQKTVSADRGIFLPETWRLNPEICAFTSEVFYEGRLRTRAGLQRQVLRGIPSLGNGGLWVVHVQHEGCRSSSPEEVDAVDRIVADLLGEGARWRDADGNEHPMTPSDVVVVAPYNAQVELLSERLEPRGVRVGTVDRFQGQQAPAVVYSMATSSPIEAPHGMEFLYSPNRLNVATSRARCCCILVASPQLFEPDCKTPRQMQLANALCRYRELANLVA